MRRLLTTFRSFSTKVSELKVPEVGVREFLNFPRKELDVQSCISLITDLKFLHRNEPDLYSFLDLDKTFLSLDFLTGEKRRELLFDLISSKEKANHLESSNKDLIIRNEQLNRLLAYYCSKL